LIISLIFLVSGCCKRCCSPSIEVGVLKPGDTQHYQPNKIQIWTWSPLTNFPSNPNIQVMGNQLLPLRPYLPKVEVTNFSNVEARAVSVTFYWANFGLFDIGTPIGSVAVDLPANKSSWVNGPAAVTLGNRNMYHICLSARVFHPCDTDLRNNYCFKNFQIIVLPWPWKIYVVPFTIDFRELAGRIVLKVEPSDPRIVAHITPDSTMEGSKTEIPTRNFIDKVDVVAGKAGNYSLILENTGDLKLGETFEITVSADQNDKTVASFTTRFQAGEKK